MSERRTLVIGSQCDARQHLSFLPAAVVDLYAVLTDPEIGGWVPALPDGRGLVIDPTVAETTAALRDAFQHAANDAARLLITFVGHGLYRGDDDDLFLLPKDGTDPPTGDTAIPVIHLLREQWRIHPHLPGLIVIIDAGHAGQAASGAAVRWRAAFQGQRRFVMFTALDGRPAFEGCFSRELTTVLLTGLAVGASEEGVPVAMGAVVSCDDLAPFLTHRCFPHGPHCLSFGRDTALSLARNPVRPVAQAPWQTMAMAEPIRLTTAWYQVPPELAAIVAASREHRSVAVIGDPGSGMSSLVAALARPEVTQGTVPVGFVQAVVFVTFSPTEGAIAAQAAAQLAVSVAGFAAARAHVLRAMSPAELQMLGALQREVIGPLRWLLAETNPPGADLASEDPRPTTGPLVRLVFDEFDRLPPGPRALVESALVTLASDPALARVRLIITSQIGATASDPALARRLPVVISQLGPAPAVERSIRVRPARPEAVMASLEHRQVPVAFRQAIVERASGNWLVTSALSRLALDDRTLESDSLPADLAGAYTRRLRLAGAGDRTRWRTEFGPVLSLLAGAGLSPPLPLTLLCAASARLGGPGHTTAVCDVLIDLADLVIRIEPGRTAEAVTLCHQSLIDYLVSETSEFSVDPSVARGALEAAIEAMSDPRQVRWYATNLTGQGWVLEQRWRYAEAAPLYQRALAITEAALGAAHPDTAASLTNLALLHERQARYAEAAPLYQRALAITEAAFGATHPTTVASLTNLALLYVRLTEDRKAEPLLRRALAITEAALGAAHPNTAASLTNLALLYERQARYAEAEALYQRSLAIREAALGAEHPGLVASLNNLAGLYQIQAQYEEAEPLLQRALAIAEVALGAEHPDTLSTRFNLACLIGGRGEYHEALRRMEEVLTRVTMLLGADHPLTLTHRYHLTYWTWRAGDGRRALAMLRDLLPDQERVLGTEHLETWQTRYAIMPLERTFRSEHHGANGGMAG